MQEKKNEEKNEDKNYEKNEVNPPSSPSSNSSDRNQLHDPLVAPFEKEIKLHGLPQHQEEEEKRIQQATQEFNIYLKDSLEGQEDQEMHLFNEEQSEIRSQKQQHFRQNMVNLADMEGIGAQQIYQDDNIIRDSIFKLKQIQHEEEQLLSHFITLAKQMDQNDKRNIKRIKDFFEAFNYELAIRSNEKQKLYDKILFKDDQIYKQIRLLENNHRKLEKDYTSIKKFHEIRSLRQTGRYKKNPTNLQKMSAIPNVAQSTLKQQFLTKNTEKTHNHLLLNENTLNQPNAITNIQNPERNQEEKKNEDKKNEDKKEGKKNEEKSDEVKEEDCVIDETSVYDWIVDIDLITQIGKEGWKVYLSKKFAEKHNQTLQNTLIAETQLKGQTTTQIYGTMTEKPTSTGWEGATVAVVGLYDKGKTFVLNNLTQSNLPSGKKVNTKGISFKHVNVDAGTHLILVDTAGSYSPVKIDSEMSIFEKEATENFISDLVFEISDYFICVVNDFTSLDQRYLDRLSRSLQNAPNKTFREIIVIHNLKEVESPEILEHVWSTQVTQIYQQGSIQRTKVAAQNPLNGQLQEKHVLWFKTEFTRHVIRFDRYFFQVCLVNDDSYLGIAINPWVFSLLRYWLKAVFVPVNRPFSVVESILTFSKVKLSQFFRTNLNIKISDTEDYLIKTIISQQRINESVRIPQVSIDSSGLIMARPDSFLPATDIIAGDKYIIYMDVPGLTKEEIVVYRQNVMTIIKGNRKKPYSDLKNEKLEKSERKYGEFGLTFRIPEIYERKWRIFTVENGVLTIVYDKDKDDQIIRSKNKKEEQQ